MDHKFLSFYFKFRNPEKIPLFPTISNIWHPSKPVFSVQLHWPSPVEVKIATAKMALSEVGLGAGAAEGRFAKFPFKIGDQVGAMQLYPQKDPWLPGYI